MDTVCKDGETVIVTRKDGQNVVMLSLDDFNSIQETIYLISSRRNAERLLLRRLGGLPALAGKRQGPTEKDQRVGT